MITQVFQRSSLTISGPITSSSKGSGDGARTVAALRRRADFSFSPPGPRPFIGNRRQPRLENFRYERPVPIRQLVTADAVDDDDDAALDCRSCWNDGS